MIFLIAEVTEHINDFVRVLHAGGSHRQFESVEPLLRVHHAAAPKCFDVDFRYMASIAIVIAGVGIGIGIGGQSLEDLGKSFQKFFCGTSCCKVWDWPDDAVW